VTRFLLGVWILFLGVHAMAADWALGTASSMVKVPQTGPVAPVGAEGMALSLAGNEREAVQLVVSAGDRPLKGVRVAASPLVGEGRANWPLDRATRDRPDGIALNLVAYVHLPAFDRWDPDPLPPYRPFDVEAGRNQPVWVTVAAPKGQAAGTYQSEITVTPDGEQPRAVPLTVSVYGFSLPEVPFGRTAFGIWPDGIAQQHHVKPGSAEAEELYRKYYECLLDHLISPYSIPGDIKSPQAKRYFDDPRMTGYVIPYTDDEAKLKDTTDYLRQNGWLAKGYFYPLDEPVTKEQYDQADGLWSRIKRVAPDAKIVAPFYRGPDFAPDQTIFGIAAEHLNIWCPNTGYFNSPEVQAAMYQRLKRGDELWWYVCCGPGAPLANFFVHEDAIDHRVLMWQQKLYGITGLLYWSTTYWNPQAGTADPWVDMATVKDINPSIYGDGALIYPGAKVGVDGPVSSMRLELIRDGIEDYQYLSMLQRCAGLTEAKAAAGEVARSLTEYVKDPAELLRVRDEVAKRIEESQR